MARTSGRSFTVSTTPDPNAPARILLLLILTLALALRIWNIGWALPNAQRAFSYHVDESMVTSASLSVDLLHGKLDPRLYAYGALPFFLNSFVIHLGEAVGLVGPGPAPFIPSSGALLAARLVTVALGSVTCLFLFGTGRLLFTRVAGLIAAALYALAPLAVQHGHWATVDVDATFFVAGALYFAARVASRTEARPRDLLWCGVWAGLAAATKYNAGLVLLAGVAAWWVRDLTPTTHFMGTRPLPASRSGSLGEGESGEEAGVTNGSDTDGVTIDTAVSPPDSPLSQRGTSARERGVGGVRSLLIASALTFVITCPTILVNPRGVLEAIVYESQHTKTGHGATFVGTGSGFLYHISYNLSWALTFPLLFFVLAGVVAAIMRRKRGDGVLAAFAIPYYILIGLAAVKFARYNLPLFPPLFIWTGALISGLAAWRRPAATVAGVLLGAAAAWALLFSLALDKTMGAPDTRDEAAAYIRSNPNIRSVGFAKGPWFYSPTLGPLLTHPLPAIAQKSAIDSSNPTLIPDIIAGPDGKPMPIEWDLDLLRQTNPDAVAINEFEYADAQRVGQKDAMDYLAAMEAMYPNRQVFAHPVEVFGIPFTKLNTKRGLPSQNLPEDMRYPNPTEIVFTK